MSIQLIITFSIKQEKIESFLKIMEDVKVSLPKVKGCEGVEIFEQVDDKYSITLIETWKSIENHQTHITNVIDSGDWEYISSHLENDPQSNYFNQI